MITKIRELVTEYYPTMDIRPLLNKRLVSNKRLPLKCMFLLDASL